jgi:molybdenum cofactor cytidylyltransferase
MDAPESATPHVVVLAAGGSSRFGSPKQLVRLKGRPLLHLAVARAGEVGGHDVTVVLGAHANELAPLLKHSPVSVVINRGWREGIASSIRAGLKRVPAGSPGVLLMLADQAAVSGEDLRRLVGVWRAQPHCIVAAYFETITGVPAVFPREDFASLARLRGDEGARALLRGRSSRIVRFPLPSAALDIDTPEDLLRV